MNRREFHRTLGAALAMACGPHAAAALAAQHANGGHDATRAQQSGGAHAAHGADDPLHRSVPSGPPQQIGMLIYPNLTALDLVGPYTFLNGLMNVDLHLVWKDTRPFQAGGGMPMAATRTLAECPRDLDVLFVPGGMRGTIALMRDAEILDFLADRGSRARYVTSVCTGALLLGCAGLLRGYRATTYWATHDLLPLVGATPVKARVVTDRNRITGGGVTSGIDFGLVLASRMRDEGFAKMLQLANEYDPQPPFNAGSPDTAGPEIADHLRRMLAPGVANARGAIEDAAKRWRA